MDPSSNQPENVAVHDQRIAPSKPEVAVSGPAVESAPKAGEEKIGEPSSAQHQSESQQGPQTTDESDKQHEELTSGQAAIGESSTHQLQQNIEAEDVSWLIHTLLQY